MSQRLVLLITQTACWTLCAVGCGVSTPVEALSPTDGFSTEPPQDLVQSRPKREMHDRGYYRGVVAAVGTDWFELGAGWIGETHRKMQQDHKKPQRISTTGTTPGGNPEGEGEQQTHRVSDLKVGDVVRIKVDFSRAGDNWTRELIIERRPGGKIPPQFGDPFAETHPHLAFHLQDQAYQDWEEKGVPIPVRYLTDGRAPWTNPPYPPVAPQPRPAKP